MKWLAILGMGVMLMMAASLPARAELKVGDEAPGFSLMGSDGRVHNLADFRGQKPVVIAWFPKAFTGG